MNAATTTTCITCGTPVTAEVLDGKCPACLKKVALMEPTMPGDTLAVPLRPRSKGTRKEPDIPQPEELAALLPGDHYAVESFLGAGGMGAVYKGTQVRLQRKVAIKIMRRDRTKDQGFEERFRREALAMAQLNHPNIVNVIDYGEAGADYLYIVMEFIDGTDLVNVILSGEMTQELALKLLPQICDALQFAHDNGIVHRDIKPANILLTRDGRIKMADFGLAKRFDAENSYRTQSGYGMGTPDYAAPEQFMGDANVDHRADIYALGVMIYQMVTGTLPRGAWKPPSEKAAVDAFWDHIVARALQTDPHDRYASASEIKTDLGSITPTTGAPRPAPEGTLDRNTAGMTGAQGSTTALTQAGGRPVTKTRTLVSKGDVQPTKSSRSRVPVLHVAALIVLAAGGYFAWKTFHSAALPAASVADVGQSSVPRPKVWVDATPELREQVLTSGVGKMDGEWLVTTQGAGFGLATTQTFKDVAMRVTLSGPVLMYIRRSPGMPNDVNVQFLQNYTAEVDAAGYALLYRWDAKRQQKTGFPEQIRKLADGFNVQDEHEVIMTAQGDQISVWVNDQLVISQKDSALKEGVIGMNWFVSRTRPDVPLPRIKKVEYGDLGGTPSLPASQSAVSRTWHAPPPTAIASTEWTDIIPHIKPERDAMRGAWTVDGGSLSIQRAPWAVCRLPVQDPGTDYDLRYRITRGEGDHRAMFFFFEKGNTGAFVAMDYINPALPEFADGQRWLRMEGNPENIIAKRKEWLPRGKECTVLLQVREKEVIVLLDDEEVFRTPVDWSRLSQGGGTGRMRFGDLTGETIFGVSAHDCHTTFHSIEMRKVEPVKDKTAPLPAITIGTEWTDIVTHIKPERDVVRGDWKSGKDGLACVNMIKWSLCRFPVQPPAGDYEVRYKLTRTGGPVDGLFFPFLHGNDAGSFAVDYPGYVSFDGMRRVALQEVKGRATLEKPSEIVAVRKEWIPFGKTCTVLLQVRAKEVRVLVDDVEAIRWQADWSQIQQSKGGYPWASVFQGLKEPIFGIGLFSNEVVYHSIEMRRVGEAKATSSAFPVGK